MHVSRFAASCLTGCFVAGWGLLLWQGAEAGRPTGTAARPEQIERPADAARAELPKSVAEPSREPDATIEPPPAFTKGQLVIDGDAAIVVEAVPGNRAWGPEQAEGPPNTNEAGDIQTAWASRTPDDQPEWLICRFATAVDLKAVVIHETFNPGAVVKVSAFDAQNKEVRIWEGVDPTPRDAAKGVSTIPVKADFKINRIKIYVDSPAVPGWNEIDAVGLRDVAGEVQWANKVEASSTFASDNAGFVAAPGKRGWGPEQVEGPPDTPEAGDIVTAWASLTTDGQAEWLICKYAAAVETRAIVIHETYNPGAVTKVSAFDPENKEVVIWEGVDPTPRDVPKGISVIPVKAKFKIDRIKIYIDSPAVPGWNEIDAVGLRDAAGETQWASKVEASTTYAMQQARPAPPSIVIRAEELERLRRVDAEVKELRKEVDRLKRLEADVEELKKLIKERQP